MKKFIVLTLIISIFCNSASISKADQSVQNSTTLSTLNIRAFNIGDNTFLLKGDIGDNDFISIKGNLYKSKYYDNLVVGDVDVINGDYQVVHFTISNKMPLNALKINHSLYNKPALQLYLKDLRSGNIITIEQPINTKFDYNKITSLPDELEFIEHWWIKAYKPTIKISQSPKYTDDRVDTDYINIRYELEWPERGWYEYQLVVKLESSVRDIDGGETFDNAMIYIESESIDSSDDAYKDPNKTPMVVKNIKAQIDISSKYSSDLSNFKDRIISFEWDGSYSKKTGGGKVAFGISKGILNLGSISWSPVTWTAEKTRKKQFLPSDTVVSFKYNYPEKSYIDGPYSKTSNSFGITFWKERYADSNVKNQYTKFKFTYDVGSTVGNFSSYEKRDYLSTKTYYDVN